MPHSDEKFRRGEPFSLSFFSGIEKVCVRGGGEYQNFPSKVISLTVPKVSVGESLYCFSIVGYRKSLDKRVGVSRFSVETFFPHSAESFRRGVPLSVSIISGIEKV